MIHFTESIAFMISFLTDHKSPSYAEELGFREERSV